MLLQWVFRGQADASWSLSPSIERLLNRLPFGWPKFNPFRLEEHFRQKFMRYAHAFLSEEPTEENVLEWLALVQHHGGPTTLLDVTHSFYVAAFFAFADVEVGRDVAIWAICPQMIDACLLRKHPELREKTIPEAKNTRDPVKSRASQLGWRDRLTPGNWGATVLEPYRMNERLMVQQGAFLCSVGSQGTLQENIFGVFDLTPADVKQLLEPVTLTPKERFPGVVAKFVLASNLRQDALMDLKRMNVTWASLFPGLDGYARQLYLELLVGPRPPWVEEEDPMAAMRAKAAQRSKGTGIPD